MEGDVLGAPGEYLMLLAMIGSAVVGGVWGLLRWFSGRIFADLDHKLGRIEVIAEEVERVDAAHQRLLAELPALYQRRDDAIREYTAITAKLDRMWETLLEIRNGR